jgi:hypothetical protein
MLESEALNKKLEFPASWNIFDKTAKFLNVDILYFMVKLSFKLQEHFIKSS